MSGHYAIGAVVGIYAISSFILNRKPWLIHKRKQLDHFKCQHISHRGGAAHRLENTLSAFHFAKECQTDLFEIDCHLTKDGKVVVAHDDNLERLCDAQGKFSDYSSDELPLLRDSLWLHFHKSQVATATSDEDRRVLFLEDLFKTFPDMNINIDLKKNDEVMFQEVHRLIKKYHMEKHVVWGNKSSRICNRLYSIDPEIPLIVCLTKVLLISVCYQLGLLPFLPLKESFYEVPRLVVFKKHWKSQMPPAARVLFFMAPLLDHLALHPGLVRHLDRRGMKVLVWVCNDEDDWDWAFARGVHGVMTDFPPELRAYLDRKTPPTTNGGINNNNIDGRDNNHNGKSKCC